MIRIPKNFHSMTIKPINSNRINKEMKERSNIESLLRVNLTDISDKSKEKYLDRYEGIKSEILNTTRDFRLKYNIFWKDKYDSR